MAAAVRARERWEVANAAGFVRVYPAREHELQADYDRLIDLAESATSSRHKDGSAEASGAAQGTAAAATGCGHSSIRPHGPWAASLGSKWIPSGQSVNRSDQEHPKQQRQQQQARKADFSTSSQVDSGVSTQHMLSEVTALEEAATAALADSAGCMQKAAVSGCKGADAWHSCQPGACSAATPCCGRSAGRSSTTSSISGGCCAVGRQYDHSSSFCSSSSDGSSSGLSSTSSNGTDSSRRAGSLTSKGSSSGMGRPATPFAEAALAALAVAAGQSVGFSGADPSIKQHQCSPVMPRSRPWSDHKETKRFTASEEGASAAAGSCCSRTLVESSLPAAAAATVVGNPWAGGSCAVMRGQLRPSSAGTMQPTNTGARSTPDAGIESGVQHLPQAPSSHPRPRSASVSRSSSLGRQPRTRPYSANITPLAGLLPRTAASDLPRTTSVRSPQAPLQVQPSQPAGQIPPPVTCSCSSVVPALVLQGGVSASNSTILSVVGASAQGAPRRQRQLAVCIDTGSGSGGKCSSCIKGCRAGQQPAGSGTGTGAVEPRCQQAAQQPDQSQLSLHHLYRQQQQGQPPPPQQRFDHVRESQRLPTQAQAAPSRPIRWGALSLSMVDRGPRAEANAPPDPEGPRQLLSHHLSMQRDSNTRHIATEASSYSSRPTLLSIVGASSGVGLNPSTPTAPNSVASGYSEAAAGPHTPQPHQQQPRKADVRRISSPRAAAGQVLPPAAEEATASCSHESWPTAGAAQSVGKGLLSGRRLQLLPHVSLLELPASWSQQADAAAAIMRAREGARQALASRMM